MRSKFGLVVVLTLPLLLATTTAEQQQPMVTMDEYVWVAFYDVPSRRFREIRGAVVRRDFGRARHDLIISANHIQVEASRALPALALRLNDVSGRLTWFAENIETPEVTLADLDTEFGRAHWLLAQHYLHMARQSRDSGQNQNAGRYLWATTHHMERAVLWSNSRIDRELHKALEGLRELSTKLQDDELAAKAYREKPILRAEKVLRKLGNKLDRPVVLPAQSAKDSDD